MYSQHGAWDRNSAAAHHPTRPYGGRDSVGGSMRSSVGPGGPSHGHTYPSQQSVGPAHPSHHGHGHQYNPSYPYASASVGGAHASAGPHGVHASVPSGLGNYMSQNPSSMNSHTRLNRATPHDQDRLYGAQASQADRYTASPASASFFSNIGGSSREAKSPSMRDREPQIYRASSPAPERAPRASTSASNSRVQSPAAGQRYAHMHHQEPQTAPHPLSRSTADVRTPQAPVQPARSPATSPRREAPVGAPTQQPPQADTTASPAAQPTSENAVALHPSLLQLQKTQATVNQIRLELEAICYTQRTMSDGDADDKIAAQRKAYNERMMQALLTLDSVETNGVEEIKRERKTLVNGIQAFQDQLTAFVEREMSLHKLILEAQQREKADHVDH